MLMKRAPWPACDYHARMDLLRPVVKPYAWGSTDAIAQLQGRPVPAPGPEAELWEHDIVRFILRGGIFL